MDVEARLARLERRVRVWQGLTLAGLLLGGIGLWGAPAKAQGGGIGRLPFRFVDEAGEKAAEIRREGEKTLFTLYSRGEKERVMLTTEPDASGIALLDREGKLRAVLGTLGDVGSLILARPNGEASGALLSGAHGGELILKNPGGETVHHLGGKK